MGFGLGSIGDAFGRAADAFGDAVDSAADSTMAAFSRAMDAVDDATDALSEASFSDIGHTVLDVAGMVPVIGEVADLANAGWYAAEGDYKNAALSAAGAIPFAGNAATAAKWGSKAADVAGTVAKTTDAASDLAKATDTATDVAKAADASTDAATAAARADVPATTRKADVDKPEVSYDRPSGFRKGVRDEVWENAKDANGVVKDPVTGNVMDKAEPWDMGHKPGYEFRKHAESAEQRGISRSEFLDEHNDVSKYQPELPSSNRSHRGEDVTDTYFGY